MQERTVSDTEYMRLAFEEALIAYEKGEVPVGALVVHENRIVSKAHNLRESLKDPSAHAEILALRRAAEAIDSGAARRVLDVIQTFSKSDSR